MPSCSRAKTKCGGLSTIPPANGNKYTSIHAVLQTPERLFLSKRHFVSGECGTPFRNFRTGIVHLRERGHSGDAPRPGGLEFRKVRIFDSAHDGERHMDKRDQGLELVQTEEADPRELFGVRREDRADASSGE